MMKPSYSYEGQDRIAFSLLRSIKKGNYIDIGANHPILNNNTYLFYEKLWTGLAIDGNNEFNNLWKDKRPNDIFINELISDDIKEANFEIYKDKEISSIDYETQIRYRSRILDKDEIKSKKIKTNTLTNILKQINFTNKEIHLLSIDVEGEDFNVLKGLDFNLFQPGLIIIENKNYSINKTCENKIADFLKLKDYVLISKTPLDSFFINPNKKYFNWLPEKLRS